HPQPSTPFPYTTLFRSLQHRRHRVAAARARRASLRAIAKYSVRDGRLSLSSAGKVAAHLASCGLGSEACIPQGGSGMGAHALARSEEHTSELQSRENLV